MSSMLRGPRSVVEVEDVGTWPLWAVLPGGLVEFYGMTLVLYLVAGVSFPWAFYAFIGAMTISGGVREGRYPDHLGES
jgi:hypothetical protein